MPITLSLAILLIVIGFGIGIVGGMVGIGGGVIIIPLLMFFFGFTQQRANGTSIAMLLPPIGVFAALSYYRAGNVNVPFAALMAFGFAFGAYLGATAVNRGLINPIFLRVAFAIVLVYCASRILFRPGGRAAAAVQTAAVAAAVFSYAAARVLAGHLQGQPTRWGDFYRSRRHEPFENDYEI